MLDISPWAITFYSLTLVATTLYQIWDDLAKMPGRAVGLFLVAAGVSNYAAFTVIWRHDASFVPGTTVYLVAISLLLMAIAFCYSCQK